MTTITEVLDTVNSALSVVRKVADIPGVSLIPYVSTISTAIGALQAAYAAGRNVQPYIDAIKNTFAPGATAPTEADMAALDAKIASLETQVDAPLPPREDGEPE